VSLLSSRRVWRWFAVVAMLAAGTWLMATRFREPRPRQAAARPIATLRVEAAPKPQQPPSTPPAAQPISPPSAETDQQEPDTCEPPTGVEIAGLLTKELEKDFPNLGSLVVPEDTKASFDQRFSLLIQILQDVGDTSADRKPVLLLAANQVASNLVFPFTYPPTPDMKQKIDQLKSYGLTFSWSQLGASYEYEDDLLWVLWRDYTDTPSGEDAFLLLLNRGWDTSKTCAKGSDQFRDVIREGEAFLKRHPESAHAATLDYDVAQAYETWWSLGKAPQNNEEEVSPERYVDGASAGERALDYYNQLAQKYPQSAESACAKQSIDLLQQGKDTRQRRYFCVYD
jgi:hypothetical protein